VQDGAVACPLVRKIVRRVGHSPNHSRVKPSKMWYVCRMMIVQDCPHCKGTGKLQDASGKEVDCRKCSGGKIVTEQASPKR